MIKKLLFTDTETTGLDPDKNGIHEISGIIEIDGEVKEKFQLFVSPFKNDIIEKEALDVTGVRVEKIKGYPSPEKAFKELIKIMEKYIDRYDKNDKFFFMAYNSPFDDQFLRSFFKKNHNNYYGSWFRKDICIMRLAAHYLMNNDIILPSYSQISVATYLGIAQEDEKGWHTASYDVDIAKKIYDIVKGGS